MSFLTNDLGLDLSFYTRSGGKTEYHSLKNGERLNVGNCGVFRENLWKDSGKAMKIFRTFYIFDFVFGNAADEENLPIGLDFEVAKDGEISLSSVAEVKKEQVDRWEKAGIFQLCLAFGILEIILIALSLFLPPVGKISFAVIALAFVFLFVSAMKKRKSLAEKIRRLEK